MHFFMVSQFFYSQPTCGKLNKKRIILSVEAVKVKISEIDTFHNIRLRFLDALASPMTMFKIQSLSDVFKITRFQEYYRVLQSITEYYRALQSITE